MSLGIDSLGLAPLGLGVEAAGGGDTTAPTLTSPTGTQTGTSTASGTVSTDEANGTLYAVARLNSSGASSRDQVIAGQNAASAAAPYATNQSISSIGSKSVNATGLTPSTAHCWDYCHVDAAGNKSAVVSSYPFTTSAGGGGGTVQKILQLLGA